MIKLIEINNRFKNLFTELQSNAAKHNQQKTDNRKYNLFDEIFMQNFAGFFDKNEKAM